MLGQHIRGIDVMIPLQVLNEVVKATEAIVPLVRVAIAASVLRSISRLRADMTGQAILASKGCTAGAAE